MRQFIIVTGIGILAAGHCVAAEACRQATQSVVPIRPATPGSQPGEEAVPPVAEMTYTIRRGTSEDLTSCADLGFISIYVKPTVWVEPPRSRTSFDVGYEFELVRTTIANGPLSSGPSAISPTEAESGFYVFQFAWGDGASEFQEPLELEIDVYTVDPWLRRSRPCRLSIRHSGGRPSIEPEQGEIKECE